MGGLAVDVSAIRRALPDRVMLVEDAAHALGARDAQGRQIGSSGNLVSFSFYANKNLSTGEGGAIALNDRETASRLRSLRLHGLPADAWMRFTNPNVLPSAAIEILGYKMNFTDLQSAIGRVQLSRYATMQARRHAIARRYVANLSDVCGLQFQEGILSDDHARHLLLVLLPADASARGMTRDQVVLGLRAANIGATVHYHPLHRMPLYAAYRTESLPVTEDLAARILTLPISATMSEADVDYVSGHLRRLLRKEA
jgi:dTDP-4-amino-4,6-dideoxygalactose transaminase